ncbi:MAG: hypothetical protein OEV21_02160 [Thermoplasmata archaeon]|nr:hypothetical protein [Thermoplasmata archaeon]
MKEEEKKFGWELVMSNFDDLNKLFKVENGKIVAWYCHESKEWVADSFKCPCGTILEVSEFQTL